MKKILHTLLLLTLLLGLAPDILAANHTVMPLAYNLDVNKRDLVSETITIANKSERMVRVYASVNEVAVDGDGVLERFKAPSEVDRTNTPTAWIEITRGRIELAPGEVREVPFTIRMNPNTVAGDYSVYIGFAEASNKPQAEQVVMAGGAPGTLLNLSVDKQQNVFLRLERFLVDRFVTKERGGTLTYELSNPGRVDVVPKGELIFYSNNGREVAALPLNPQDSPVAANAEQTYEIEVPDELRIGKYKAFLSVEYGEHLTAAVHDTAFFYVVPLKQLIAAFVIITIFAVFIALYVYRRYDMDTTEREFESVPMYIRNQQRSDEKDHDIDLKRKDNE